MSIFDRLIHFGGGILNNIAISYVNHSNRAKNKWVAKQGAIIGNGNRFNCDVDSFGTEPWLIKIGDDCLIARNVHFITHDGGIKVLNSLGFFSERMDNMGAIELGNNVYIGMGAYIMPNVRIGNNVVIGANSVVTHNIPDNVVAAGIPAKPIKSLDCYYETLVNKGRLFPTANMDNMKKKSYYDNINLFKFLKEL